MRFAGYQPKSSTLTQSKSDFTVPQVCFVDSVFVTWNVFSLPMNKISIQTLLSTTRMTESGRAARKLTSILNVFSSSGRSLHRMWWFQLACVSAARDGSTLLTRVLQWILHTTLVVSFPFLSKIAFNCFLQVISFSKMARQHTQLVPRRTGYKSTVQISLTKTSNLQIHQTWIPQITMFGERCWRPITSAIQNLRQSPNSRKHCRRSGTAYLKARYTEL